MRDLLASPWIDVVAAIVGGLSLGLGLGRLATGSVAFGALLALAGVVLLWWALSDARKAQRGTPEDERDGSHTIE